MRSLNLFLLLFITISLELSLTRGSYRTYSRRQRQQQLRCPEATGQFAHPTKCNHFINCWKGDAVEDRCPGSLLFNPKISACDWARNVVCPAEQVNEAPAFPPPDNSIPSNSESLLPEEGGGGAPSPPPEPTLRPTYRPKPRPPFQPVVTPQSTTQTATEPPGFLPLKPKPPNRPGIVRPTGPTTTVPVTPVPTSTLVPAAQQELPEFATNEPQPYPDNGLIPFPAWPNSIKCSERQSLSGVTGYCDAVVVCLNGQRHFLRCLPDQMFDPALGSCVSMRNVNSCISTNYSK